jgi:ParB-like chromosome segregation protein Spo0J
MLERIQVPLELLRPSATRTNHKLVLHLWAELKRKQRFNKPLIVRPEHKGVYVIEIGNSRYAAMKNAGWAGPVDCVVAHSRDDVATARLLKDRT